MGTKYNPSIVRNGLVFCVDPASLGSYSGSGLTVNGLVSGIGGTLVNGIGFSSQNSGSFFFDGTNDYFLASDDSKINLLGDLSATVWFRINALNGDWVRVLGKGDSTNRTYGFWYYGGSPNYFLYQRYGATNGGAIVTTTLQLNVWYHAVVTSEGSTHRLYLNGSEIGNVTIAPPFLNSSSPFRLGYGEIHSYHNGNISHTTVYNRALTAAEILQNYNATKARYQ